MGSRVVEWRNRKFGSISVIAAACVVGTVLLAEPQSAAARSYWSSPFGSMHSVNPWGSFFSWGRRRHSGSAKRRHRDAQRERSQREQAQAAKGLQGPFHVVVSLSKQRLTLYDGTGEAVAHSPVSTGVPSHPTPTGVFSVLERRRWHHSNIYSGAPMPYMQRITWSGIALHAGELPGGPASHGCIRLPAKFANTLWHTTRVGARVIIVQDDLEPVAFSHPSLLALKPEPPPPPPTEAPPAEASAAELSMSPAAGDEARAATVQTVAVADAATAVDAAPSREARKRAKRSAPKLRPGPVSVFVSRTTGKVYVRKGFVPVLSAPVSIERPDQPLGTHVFTALGLEADGTTMRFSAATVSRDSAGAAAALDRITLPPDVVERVSKLMTPGASVIISDKGLGHETGRGTDFIVLTH
jgi:lipoprotein-anchoring transpeptidase ErfK/SrfK